ncbi:MAG: hypothetical protein ACR2M7_02325 [Bdellovibrionales bacterium]
MIKKTLFIQVVLALALAPLTFVVSFNYLAFLLVFLFSQVYGCLFLKISRWFFERKKTSVVLSFVFLKWVVLVILLYGALILAKPIEVVLGLIFLPSFFITFAVLEKKA